MLLGQQRTQNICFIIFGYCDKCFSAVYACFGNDVVVQSVTIDHNNAIIQNIAQIMGTLCIFSISLT